MISRSELTQGVVNTLHGEDYSVYYNEGLRRYFDLIGIRETRLFIKILMNLDNLGRGEGNELRKFADAFSSHSIVVGDHAGGERLRDDVIYQRFENICINLDTFKEVIHGQSITTFTKRGQFLVSIDGGALKRFREEQGFSREDLAQKLNCSSQTIYRSEKQNRIQEELYEKLVKIFKNEEFEKEAISTGVGRLTETRPQDPIKQDIMKEFFRLKLNAIAFDTPVDFALENKPVLTPVSRSELELRKKQRIAKNLEEVLGCDVVHITRVKKNRKLPHIYFDELKDIETKEEILERSS